jgi:hypothetical protein
MTPPAAPSWATTLIDEGDAWVHRAAFTIPHIDAGSLAVESPELFVEIARWDKRRGEAVTQGETVMVLAEDPEVHGVILDGAGQRRLLGILAAVGVQL